MLREIGIDPEVMKKIGPPTSPVLEYIEDLLPEPDHDKVERMVMELGGYDGKP